MKFRKCNSGKKIACLAGFLLVLAGALAWLTFRSYRDPVVTQVTLESGKVAGPVRYVYLADLHERVFGENNQQLYDRLEDLDPDFILIGGDLINWTSEEDAYAVEVIRRLAGIADVYYSIGNHEIEYLRARSEIFFNGSNRNDSSLTLLKTEEEGFLSRIQEAGAILLQKNWTDIEVRGTKVRIGAAYEGMFSLDPENPKETMLPGMYDFLTSFQDTQALTLYMTHRPYSFLNGNGSALWDIDVVLCGHEHGGQVVFPILGGLFSRERGIFPGYTHGVFSFGRTTLLVSSGIGSDAELLPRFNNPPEILLVTIQ